MVPRPPIFHLFLALSTTILCISAATKNEPYAIRISCGAREDLRTKPADTLWYRDFGYTGGRFANATRPSFIIPQLPTLRYFPLSDGPENCYKINIRNGRYAVRLFFALVKDPEPQNEPTFDISIEGTLFYSMKPGWSNHDEESFTEALVYVTTMSLSACFHSTGHGDPAILAIEVLQVDESEYLFDSSRGKGIILRTAKRLTCGSAKSAFDEDYGGSHWGGDRFWSAIASLIKGSDQSLSTAHNITRVSVAPNFYPERLYQSAILSTDIQPELSFQMEVVPNKNYSVWLHFAEIDPRVTKEGQRVFDVLINGDIVFTSVDIIHMTGEPYASLVLNKTAIVTGKTLTVTLRPINGSHAIINAIEVFEIIAAERRTSLDEVRALKILKKSLGLPLRFGWNGDPCVPQQHPWSGIDCQFDSNGRRWVIDGLGLDNQGLRGVLPADISKLPHLQSINLSGNNIHGGIPSSLGTITGLEILDLSYNQLNGSIPESLGQLTSLQTLNLNGNLLSGEVPAKLGGRPLHRASFNFTGNAGLCGIPGLPSCGSHLSTGAKIGIAFAACVALLMLLTCLTCWWKRRQNILRAQRIATPREAPYAKARTQFTHDVQMTRHQRVHDHARSPTDSGPPLLS